MYKEKQFSIPTLAGISTKTIETHLKLYAAYVKNTNAVLESINEMEKDTVKNSSILAGLYRRLPFEWNGMRNHEYYFAQFEDGGQWIPDGKIVLDIKSSFGSFEEWKKNFSALAANRGVGWAALYYDKQEKRLLTSWIEEQHIGVHTSLEPILLLDVWEHAFILDYAPAEKTKHIEAFFENINWNVIEKRYQKAIS